MALSKAGLATRIKDELEVKFGTADDGATLTAFAEGMAEAIIDEFLANGVASIPSHGAGGAVDGTIE